MSNDNGSENNGDPDPMDCIYPFENLVFEGGGMKGLAYCGVVEILDHYDILPQIKRFGGSSAGASVSTMLALGYLPQDLIKYMSKDLSPLFKDAKFGILSALPNLLTKYGWHPARGISAFFGEAIANKFNGNADLTFSELYSQTGKELCIVVTNVNHMTEEYCHVKTTPNMPIRTAVRMSMGVPGALTAVPYTSNGETNFYVDGGVLCNLPIHCYDGWWLSMEPGDSFLERLQPLEQIPHLLTREDRFSFNPDNNKTLGHSLFTESDKGIFKFLIEDKYGCHLGKYPDTKLARKRQMNAQVQEECTRKYSGISSAVGSFLKVLKKHNIDRDDKIDRTELQSAFNDPEFLPEHANLLFGKHCTAEKAFEIIDKDQNGKIEFHELVDFIQGTGIKVQKEYLGYERQEFDGMLSFLTTLGEAVQNNLKCNFVERKDIERLVGINSGYISAQDFQQEPADRIFLINQGRISMDNFLQHYAKTHDLPKRNVGKNRRKKILHPIKVEEVDIPVKNFTHFKICVYASVLFISILLFQVLYN